MDVKGFRYVLFASILIQISWFQVRCSEIILIYLNHGTNKCFQTEAHMEVPNCGFLGEKFGELWRSKKPFEDYQQFWGSYFTKVIDKFYEEIVGIFEQCPIRPGQQYTSAKQRNQKKDVYRNKLRAHALDKSLIEKYIKSIQVQDKQRMVSAVEEKCDEQMMSLWDALISFKVDVATECGHNSFATAAHPKIQVLFLAVFPRGQTLTYNGEVDIQIDLENDHADTVLQHTVHISADLIDRINKRYQKLKEKMEKHKQTVYEKANEITKNTNHTPCSGSDQVFVKGVERLKGMEQGLLQTNSVHAKVQMFFQNKPKRSANDLESFLQEVVSDHLRQLNAFGKRLRILYYQFNFL